MTMRMTMMITHYGLNWSARDVFGDNQSTQGNSWGEKKHH